MSQEKHLFSDERKHHSGSSLSSFSFFSLHLGLKLKAELKLICRGAGGLKKEVNRASLSVKTLLLFDHITGDFSPVAIYWCSELL